jgi:hypothetical protein
MRFLRKWFNCSISTQPRDLVGKRSTFVALKLLPPHLLNLLQAAPSSWVRAADVNLTGINTSPVAMFWPLL